MIKCYAEYYTDEEPITNLEFRAFTKRGALRKAFNNEEYVNSLNLGRVRWMQVWFRGKKIFGNGNTSIPAGLCRRLLKKVHL